MYNDFHDAVVAVMAREFSLDRRIVCYWYIACFISGYDHESDCE